MLDHSHRASLLFIDSCNPISSYICDAGADSSGEDLDVMPVIDFRPHTCFKQSTREKKGSQRRTVSIDALGQTTTSKVDQKKHSCFQRHQSALHPGGHFRTGWNLAVAICVLHDLIFVPLEVFELPKSVPLTALEWMTQIFWNFDFLVSLRTGYYQNGALVLDPWKAFQQYARTWMPFDCFLISLDWAIVWIDATDAGFAQWSRTLTMLRFLRLARMLRWVKLQRVNEVFQELLHSQANSWQMKHDETTRSH